jgi:hypothetical protein
MPPAGPRSSPQTAVSEPPGDQRDHHGTLACSPVEWQLRIYEIEDGELDAWIAEWREHVAPLRRRLGFRILGPWVDGHTFVWLLGFENGEEFGSADANYYSSSERRAVDPDPARHIKSATHRMLHDIPE